MKNKEFTQAIEKAERAVGIFSCAVLFITILHLLSLFV